MSIELFNDFGKPQCESIVPNHAIGNAIDGALSSVLFYRVSREVLKHFTTAFYVIRTKVNEYIYGK